MNALISTDRGRWTVAGAGALFIMCSLLVLFRLPAAPIVLAAPGGQLTAKSPVQIATTNTTDVVLKEEAIIRDLRPLFLPTQFNAALPEPRREPGRSFLDDENLRPDLIDADMKLNRDLLPGMPTAELAGPVAGAALLAEMPGAGLVGFGRKQTSIEPLPARAGFVEVIETGTGERVLGETLPESARTTGEKAWEPVEFFAVVKAAGLAAPLIVTGSSGAEEVDAHFRNFLARTFRIGERLPPGSYRIVVGP